MAKQNKPAAGDTPPTGNTPPEEPTPAAASPPVTRETLVGELNRMREEKATLGRAWSENEQQRWNRINNAIRTLDRAAELHRQAIAEEAKVLPTDIGTAGPAGGGSSEPDPPSGDNGPGDGT